MMTRVMIMAGGTGGHVFPALAVAEQLRQQGVDVVWMGTQKGLEASVVPQAGFAMEWVSVSGLRGKGLVSWFFAPFKLLRALFQVTVILLRSRPMAVLGMGGFVAGPGGLMTWLLKRPLLIHEQNAAAGLTNRLLARVADRVMEAFPDTLPQRFNPQVTGNPVRSDIAALPPPVPRFADRQDGLRLLVLGGSLGAKALNEVVPAALPLIPEGIGLQIWHQTGSRNFEATQSLYADCLAGDSATVAPRIEAFITDMAAAYGWADLVLCRAGALTIAELAAAGVGALLIPYPYAVDDHQTANAAWLVSADAAQLLQQTDLSPEWLADQLTGLWGGAADEAGESGRRQRLLAMANNARALARIDATEQVARACMEAAHG